MGTILNKVVPNRKVQIRIIKDGFSSPVLGLTYIGQIKTLNIATATAFVKGGYAEFVTDGDEQSPLPAPDGGAKTSPAAPESTNEDTAVTLEDAIKSLDPEDDAHWTKSGLPDLNVLKEKTGEAVRRNDVEDVAPDFTREVARENKG